MRYTLFLIALLLLSVSVLQAQHYTARSYKVTVTGTSTMHDWSSVASNVTVKSDLSMPEGLLQKINSASVTIPAKSLKSTKNSGLMDTRTYETLKADANPNISFSVAKLVSVQPHASEVTVTVSGNLNIAGVARPTELVFTMKPLPNGDVELKGSKKILMSQHGIKPPSFMLGALKVGDEVNVTFSVVLQKV